jgi:hypothetical protein
MYKSIRFVILVLSLLSLVSFVQADDEKKDAKADKKDVKKEAAEKEAKSKMVTAGVIAGKLVRVEGAQKYLTVAVTVPYLRPATQTVNIRGRLIPVMSYQVASTSQNVELQAGDDMKVRTLQLPVDFDEKGRPKRYSSKELKELRGSDPQLPGYTADFDSLKPDQFVRVYLARKKDAPKPPPVKEKPAAKKDKDADKDAVMADKPEIAMIVILAETKK